MEGRHTLRSVRERLGSGRKGMRLLFAVTFVPILVFVGWVLVVSLVMTVAAWRVRGGTAPPPPVTTTEVG